MPTATNCCVPVTASVTGVGVTAMVASFPGITVIDGFAEMLPTDATTVLANNPGREPAVNSPVPLMVPPPAATVHVGAMETMRPSASYPTAVICCVAPATSVAFGVTD